MSYTSWLAIIALFAITVGPMVWLYNKSPGYAMVAIIAISIALSVIG